MAFICENVAWDKHSGIGVDTHMHRLFNELAAPASTNRLMMQYQAHEQQSQKQNHRRRNHENHTNTNTGGTDYPEDLGIYGDAGGLLVIDDNLHPGLRETKGSRSCFR
jgi:hypothetical protein